MKDRAGQIHQDSQVKLWNSPNSGDSKADANTKDATNSEAAERDTPMPDAAVTPPAAPAAAAAAPEAAPCPKVVESPAAQRWSKIIQDMGNSSNLSVGSLFGVCSSSLTSLEGPGISTAGHAPVRVQGICLGALQVPMPSRKWLWIQ